MSRNWSAELGFTQLEARHRLPSGLLEAVMQTESAGNPRAVSHAGAEGLFQFMPKTAAGYRVDPFNPQQSADGAARMYRDLLNQYDGNLHMALAAYNHGSRNLADKGITDMSPENFAKLPEETQKYIMKITKKMGVAGPEGVSVGGASSGATDTAAQEHRTSMLEGLGDGFGSFAMMILNLLLMVSAVVQRRSFDEVREEAYASIDSDPKLAKIFGRSDNGTQTPDSSSSVSRSGGGKSSGANDVTKDIGALHPAMRDSVRAVIDELAAMGVEVRVTETYRDPARQDALFAQGRTTDGPIVTNARGGSSYHNYAVAVDIVPVSVIGTKNWSPNHPHWAKVGEVVQRHGFTWGGNFSSITDKPHFQMQGISIAELRQLTASGRVDENGFVELPASVVARYQRGSQSLGSDQLASAAGKAQEATEALRRSAREVAEANPSEERIALSTPAAPAITRPQPALA